MSVEPYRLRNMGLTPGGHPGAGFYDVRSCRLEIERGGGAEPWNRIVQLDAVFADADGNLCRVRMLGMAHENEITIEELRPSANAGVRADRAGARAVPDALPGGVPGDGAA